jgi:alpha-L-fucosidase
VEADTPLHKGHWFWHAHDEATLKTVDELVTTYEETIGRGAQLMLGLAPDERGLIPDADVKRLEEFGAAIQRRYGENLISRHIRNTGATEAALDGDPATFWSAPEESRSAAIEVAFASPVTFDHALTMEWLNDGQRVEHYRIDAWDGKKWKPVYEGYAIGHKKIDAFPAVTSSRVRLNILSSSGEAGIREFQLYRVEPK